MPRVPCDDEFVLEKALTLMSSLGKDITLSDIGQAVGLTPATLLQRFKSKNNLLNLAAKQAHVKLKRDLERIKNENLPWNQEIIRWLIEMPEGFGSRQEINRVLHMNMEDLEIHQSFRQLFQSLRKRIYELLLKGQSIHELPISLDLETIAWELDALRHGLVIQWNMSGSGPLNSWLKDGLQNYLNRLKLCSYYGNNFLVTAS